MAENTIDPFDLERFVQAQAAKYADAIAELGSGKKRTHWMWFIFPQVSGLAMSEMSRRYAIRSIAEARAYLEHPLLGQRLTECSQTLLGLHDRTAHQIFDSPDDMKLKSSMTLFSIAAGAGSIFGDVLDKYFEGPDLRTQEILEAGAE